MTVLGYTAKGKVRGNEKSDERERRRRKRRKNQGSRIYEEARDKGVWS